MSEGLHDKRHGLVTAPPWPARGRIVYLFFVLAVAGSIVRLPLAHAANVEKVRERHDLAHIRLGLPPMTTPADNPTTPAKVALGRRLFFDKRLSGDGHISCASCHEPERAFSDGRRVARGIGGQRGTRKTPTTPPTA